MISRTALHAIRALVALAQLPEGTYSGAVAIAKDIGAPENYLGKLLQSLTKEGLVISQKGMGGGFRLARPARSISLFHVVEPFDHVSRYIGCFLGRAKCSSEAPCTVHNRWEHVRDAYLQLLSETTIADLLSHRELEVLAV
ncbi:MAG: Rrf2 family transcriptional regulator [Candidatus Hydrogenedentes bacterium]|nr:Rrf2 family transcriptional regulator [Candidatus Hydrogenedentota bacterium]